RGAGDGVAEGPQAVTETGERSAGRVVDAGPPAGGQQRGGRQPVVGELHHLVVAALGAQLPGALGGQRQGGAGQLVGGDGGDAAVEFMRLVDDDHVVLGEDVD